MKKLTACLVLFLSASTFLFSQTTIKGTVQDTTEKKNLTNTVVALLRKTDSALLVFTRTDKAGQFSLKTNAKGEVIVMITHPAYADYVDLVVLKENEVNELGNISMFGKASCCRKWLFLIMVR